MADEKKELTLAELTELVLKQSTQLNQVMKENAELKGAVKKEEAPKLPTIPEEPVKYDGKSYKFQVAHFHIPGEETLKITAEEAATDEEVISKILNIKGQGILKEVL